MSKTEEKKDKISDIETAIDEHVEKYFKDIGVNDPSDEQKKNEKEKMMQHLISKAKQAEYNNVLLLSDLPYTTRPYQVYHCVLKNLGKGHEDYKAKIIRMALVKRSSFCNAYVEVDCAKTAHYINDAFAKKRITFRYGRNAFIITCKKYTGPLTHEMKWISVYHAFKINKLNDKIRCMKEEEYDDDDDGGEDEKNGKKKDDEEDDEEPLSEPY